MANINWGTTFAFDVGPFAIPIPTYGNFGGPGYTNGVLAADPNPVSFNPMPVDPLDALFQIHDALSGNAATQSAVDLALVKGIVDLKPNQLDAEASVYAGVTTLVYLAQDAGSDAFQFVSDKQIASATKDAL